MGRGSTGNDSWPAGDPNEQPEHVANLSSFYLDAFEVTVARFRQFVDAYTQPAFGDGAHVHLPGSGWDEDTSGDWLLPPDAPTFKVRLRCGMPQGDCQFCTAPTWTDDPGPNESLPINCVTWAEAFAFCIWDGGYLPTEAEWEYAAAGGADDQRYPWGQQAPSASLAVFATNGPAPAGSKPLGQGKWGHHDLGGNLDEWVLDFSSLGFYGTAASNPCNDCADLKAQTVRSVRGGAWSDPAADLRAARRTYGTPTHRFDKRGLRCARPAP